MVYTVTFNPSLDYIVDVDQFTLGHTNRTKNELTLPGGKGMNVTTVLRNLGMDSTAIYFTAGYVGEEIARLVNRYGLRSREIKLDHGCSRINVKLKSIDGTEINGMGPDIPDEKLQELFHLLDELTEGDVLVLAGSVPSSVPDTIYADIAGAMEGKGVMLVVDAAKKLLLPALQFKPFLIKPNLCELTEMCGVELHSKDDIVFQAKKLQELGARNVLISMSDKGAILVDEDGNVHEMQPPKGTLVNAVGAGDSMVAGFLAGYSRNQDLHEAYLYGLCSGSASAYSEYLATQAEVEALLEQCRQGADI